MRAFGPLAVLAAFAMSLPVLAQNPPGLDFSDVGIYAVDYDFLDFTNFKFQPTDKPEGYAQRVDKARERGQFVMAGLYTWDRVTHSKPLEEVFADTDKILDAIDLSKVDMLFLSEEEVDWQGGFDYLNAIYDHVKSKYDGPVYQWYSMPMGPRCDQRADGWILDAYGMDYERFRKHLMRFIVLGKPVVACLNATPGVNSLECSKAQLRVCEEFNIPVFYYCVHGPMGSVNMYMSTDNVDTARWRSWFYRVMDKCRSTDVSRLPAETAQHSFAEDFELAGDESGAFSYTDDFAGDSFLQRASIHGFLNLTWSSLDKSIRLKPEADAAELVYHFNTPFGFKSPALKATGAGRLGISLSADGRAWSEETLEDLAQGTLVEAGLPDMAGKNLWAKIRLLGSEMAEGGTRLDEFSVCGDFVAPENRAVRLLEFADVPDRPNHLSTREAEYVDAFDSQRYLHVGEVSGSDDLVWTPGLLTTHGVEGRAVRIEVKQHFVCDKPLDLTAIALDCVAYASHGAHNELALSLDGQTPILSATTKGLEREKDSRFYGTLELPVADCEEARGVREFWVHMALVNNCGKQTNTTNQLQELRVSAQVTSEPDK